MKHDFFWGYQSLRWREARDSRITETLLDAEELRQGRSLWIAWTPCSSNPEYQVDNPDLDDALGITMS